MRTEAVPNIAAVAEHVASLANRLPSKITLFNFAEVQDVCFPTGLNAPNACS